MLGALYTDKYLIHMITETSFSCKEKSNIVWLKAVEDSGYRLSLKKISMHGDPF